MKKIFIPMKKLIIVLVTLFVIPLFLSCKEDEDEITYYNTYIDGYITDYNTGEPVKDIIFDIHYGYTNAWGGGSEYLPNAYRTDKNGYYKIPIAKTIGGDNTTSIQITPRETEDYGFQPTSFSIKGENLGEKSKRINITPISYGYLKVTLPIQDGVFLFGAPTSFEAPSKEQRLIKIDTIENGKIFLYTVAAVEGKIRHLINNGTQGPEYTFIVNMPKDTVTINLTK
ncbi:MAG: hypothetical protein PHI14_00545 [Bacteroidales bacterium]|nr:hypothetical protein [Bacteroidales bacterium]